MATIALDATYSIQPEPSGIAVYSRRLIESLAALPTRHRFLLCYRLSRFSQRRKFLSPSSNAGGPSFETRYYQEPLTFWLPRQAQVFHSLAQRPPGFRFRREIVTVFDVFPLTGVDYATEEYRSRFSALLRQAVSRATLVLAASSATREQLVAHAGVAREKIRDIPLGVDLPASRLDPEERSRERERLVGRGNIMLLSVGVIQTRKNTLNMLRALELLPANYRLVLAGGNGYGSDAVHDYIRRQGLSERVAVLGYVPAARLPALYHAANVFLFPSLEEGFGLPVLEAMAHGTPVVTSNTSSMPEVGGDAALYVDPQIPEDIAEKARQAAEDDQVRARLIARGLERAREFSWQRTAEATLKAYGDALAM
jgi:O-antigen biosynthesis alpha-1,2-mannosyltransferase